MLSLCREMYTIANAKLWTKHKQESKTHVKHPISIVTSEMCPVIIISETATSESFLWNHPQLTTRKKNCCDPLAERIGFDRSLACRKNYPIRLVNNYHWLTEIQILFFVCFKCISEIEYTAALTDITVILKTPKQTVIQEHFSIPSLLLFASLKLVVHQDPNYCWRDWHASPVLLCPTSEWYTSCSTPTMPGTPSPLCHHLQLVELCSAGRNNKTGFQR
jgi:hypothetical protein